MDHRQQSGSIFSYYQSGIHIADIRFSDTGVWHRPTGWEAGIKLTGDFTQLLAGNAGYELPVNEFNDRLAEWNG
ncbi:hypothetical protein SB767_32920, partial [Bacillus sp. SIMBA_069]